MPTWNQTADFEENNLTDFNSTVDTLSALSAQASAALAGTYGLQVALATSTVTPAYGVLNGPTAENDVTAEFLFDPNTITVATTLPADLVIFTLNTTGANPARVRLRQSAAGVFQIIGDIQTDAATFTTTSNLSISDAPHKIRILWKAATAPGANDGFLHLYIDDVLTASITGVDNDTKVVDNVFCGSVLGQDLGLTGNLYFDNIQWYAGLDYLLLMDKGNYTYTGQIINLFFGYFMSAVQGAYALTGQVTNLLRALLISAVQGAYALTGQASSFIYLRVITAVYGVYTYTGQSILNTIFRQLKNMYILSSNIMKAVLPVDSTKAVLSQDETNYVKKVE